jgi:hypothetical protein
LTGDKGAHFSETQVRVSYTGTFENCHPRRVRKLDGKELTEDRFGRCCGPAATKFITFTSRMCTVSVSPTSQMYEEAGEEMQ